MDIRQVTPRYHVSPQISAEEVADLKAAGITRIICNRPDAEVPPTHRAEAIGAAAEAAGLEFEVLPLTHQTMTPENIARQIEMVDGAPGPVLAYCASGTRCTVIWALGMAGEMPVDEILATAAKAGYDLSGLRATLEAKAAQG